MTTATLDVQASITIGATTHVLDVRDGRATLDEGWSPYAQADLTVAMPDQTVFDALDPRSEPRPRVKVTATRVNVTFNVTQTRTFDLVIVDRKLDHNEATVALTLASDEALLQDDALVATTADSTALQKQSSVRSIINDYVLAPIGAALQPGTTDADFTTLTALTNFIKNPSGEVDAANWFGNSATIARSTSKAWIGTASIAATAGAATPAWSPHASNTDRVSVTPGTPYTFSVYLLSSTSRSAFVALRYYDAQGVQLGADNQSAQTATSTTVWKRYSVTATAPANAATAFVYIRTVGDVSGTIHYSDGAMFTQGNGFDTDTLTPLAYFDGARADTALYNYDWTGTAHASTSTRTPVFQRDPSALIRQPGESMWTFIAPVLTQAGLRLFCDENRKWWLVDSTYTRPGRVTVAAGFNAYRAQDTISRTATAPDGTPLWFDSVVVKYTWNDTTNTQQTRYDVASDGTPSKTAVIEYARPYPGPGAAAYILSRVSGQGRSLDLTAAMDLAATPGMEAVATLPFTPVQTGYTSKVTWDLDGDEMTIGTRGLIDTPPAAWIRIPPSTPWTSGPVGQSWTNGPVH